MHPYRSIAMTAAWKKRFMLSVRTDFHVTESLSIAVHAFVSRVLMLFAADETLLPRSVNLSTSFKGLPFSMEMLPLWLKHMYSVLSVLTWRSMPAAARFRRCSRDSAWVGVFARSAMSSAYLLLLYFASLKPFLFIKSIDVSSTKSWQMINRYGANESPCTRYDTKNIWRRDSSPRGQGNVECSFISIAPRSTLTWSSNIWVLCMGQIELFDHLNSVQTKDVC